MSSAMVTPASLTHSPISESRRVLQESCEFFLKHNSRVQHKKKHYSPSSHKLKVISKSMGTSTGAMPSNASATPTLTNHGAATLSSRDTHPQCSLSEASVREQLDRCTSGRSSRRGVRDREREVGERQSKGGSSSKISSRSESTPRVPDVRYVNQHIRSLAVPQLCCFNPTSVWSSGWGRLTPKSELVPSGGQHPALTPPHGSGVQDSAHHLEHGVREESKVVKNNNC